MRFHTRLKKLESQAKEAESFCPACMTMIRPAERTRAPADEDPIRSARAGMAL